MRRAAAALGIFLAVTACGRKGPPVAPERRIPAPVSAFSASVEGRAVLLEWRNPDHRADGTRMKDLVALRVHRREEPERGEPKPAMLVGGRVVGYDQILAIQMAAPAPARVDGGTVIWADSSGLTFGRRYVYVVTAVDSSGRQSQPSERVMVSFHPAPEPPRNLSATPRDREVRLSWSPPAGLVDGTALPGPVAYRILRAESAGMPLLSISPSPVTATDFTDRGVQNERTYYYAVQAISAEPTGSVRSEPSPTVHATPVDLTPPSAPRNLAAVPTETAVRLAWDPSPEEDVSGYLVYRLAVPSEAYTSLTPAPVAGTVFIDRSVERGKTYRYAVTAVDRARPPNESARSAPTVVTVP